MKCRTDSETFQLFTCDLCDHIDGEDIPVPFNENVKITKTAVRQMEWGKSCQIEFLFKNEEWATQPVYEKDPLFDELKEIVEGEMRILKGWKDSYLKLIIITSIV